MKNILKMFGLGIFVLSFCVIGAKSVLASPALPVVAHNETAKTITITYPEAVYFTAEHGNSTVAAANIKDALNIFVATWNGEDWDYSLSTVAPDATITSAVFDGNDAASSGTVLVITYTGTLKETAYTHYFVDSWVVDTNPAVYDENDDTPTPDYNDGGFDIRTVSDDAVYDGGVSVAFTVIGNDTSSPELTAVIHNEKADTKSITLVFSEPVEFTSEHGDILVAAADIKNVLSIFKSDVGDYGISDIEGDVTITGATFDTGEAAGTILTITYSGALTEGQTYVVDSWVPDSAPGAGDGGYDIKDVAGNVYDGEGVNPEFTAGDGTDANGPALTEVDHNENAKTITLTYDKPIHFETEHGNIVTAVNPDMFNIFVAEGDSTDISNKEVIIGNYDLSTIAPGITIKTATLNADSTTLTVFYGGNLTQKTLKHYVLDTWVAGNGYDIKDLAGNTDVAGVDPVFTVAARHGSTGGGSSGGGSHDTTPPVTPPTTEPAPGCSAGNLFSAITGASCGNGGNNSDDTITPPAPGTVGHVDLVRQGTRGESCRAWQTYLNAHASATLAVDGICGKLTMAAARAWQTAMGLLSDGILGPLSRSKAGMQ